MAHITTTTTPLAAPEFWDIAPGAIATPYPRGQIVFAGNAVIPLTLAANTAEWNLICNFPRNFAYKLAEVKVAAFADAQVVFDDWDRGMRVLVSADIGGLSSAFTDNWAIYSEARAMMQSTNSFTFGVTGNDTMATFGHYGPLPGYFINAQEAARLTLTWGDDSSDATAATTVFFRIRALIYDIDQLRKFGIHYALSTLHG